MDVENTSYSKEHEDLTPPAFKKGGCVPGICGEEAACVPGKNLTHKCVCPSDLSPPTPDLHCPFRRTVPVSGKPFKISIGNSVTEKSKGEDISLIIIMGTVIVLILLLGSWVKRKYYFWTRAEQVRIKNYKRRMVKNPDYFEDSVPIVVLSKDSLLFHHEIGEGCFGKVFKGELLKDDGGTEIVAIKVLKESTSQEVEEDFMREVAIMNTFRHENILSFLGIACKGPSKRPWMVFQYMPLGDLACLLRKNSKVIRGVAQGMEPWSKALLLWITLQIANGMKYLSSKRFVHNDLACRNILVGAKYVIKIADFGMSRDIYLSDYYRIARSKPLPLRWMSPECLLYRKFTFESDVWSYGVVLWEIYTLGKQPYFGHSNPKAMNLIVAGHLLTPPPNCPSYIRQLMADCWQRDSTLRPNFGMILSTLYKYYRLLQAKYPKHCQEFPQPEDYIEDISEEPPTGFPGTFEEELGVYFPEQINYAQLDVEEPESEPEEERQDERSPIQSTQSMQSVQSNASIQTIQSIQGVQAMIVPLCTPEEFDDEDLMPGIAAQTSPMTGRIQAEGKEKLLKFQVPRTSFYGGQSPVKTEVKDLLQEDESAKAEAKDSPQAGESVKVEVNVSIHAAEGGCSLPRPPSYPVSPRRGSDQDLMDADNYLAPRVVEVHAYMTPLPE